MLFAVAYQNLSTHKGFITCWNVQNISYPELVISTSTNPTTVKFSIENPRLVAVGDESGMVRFISIAAASGHLPENRVISKILFAYFKKTEFVTFARDSFQTSAIKEV